MPTHVENLLTSVGIPAEDVTKIISLPEDQQAAFDSKPYTDMVKNNYQTQLQNDPNFFNDLTLEKLPLDIKKKLENTQFGRAAKIAQDRILKGFGMTDADIADLTDEQRARLEDFIPAVTEKYTKSKAGDKQLQADLIEARKKLEGFDGFEEKMKGKYETEANQKITGAIFNAALIGELSAIPGLKIPAADIAATANNILQSKYAFERVGDYAVELRQKSNPQMKVLKDGSSQELTLKEALAEIATERGWIETKAADAGSGSGSVRVEPNGKGQLSMVPPHLRDKFAAKIATESK
jgi:hypothetical protein